MSRLARRRSRACAPSRRPGLVTYTTAGDPDLRALGRDPAGARSRRRRRARGRRAVLRSAGRRPGHPARDRARAGRRRQPARVARADRAGPAARRGADRRLQLRESDAAAWASTRSRAGRPPPASTACWRSICRSRRRASFRETLAASGLDTIFLLSPTTTDARIQQGGGAGPRLPVRHLAARRDRRARRRSPSGAEALVRRIRAHTTLPIALGFGISRPEHVRRGRRVRRRGGRRQRAGVADRRGGRVAGSRSRGSRPTCGG